MLVVGKNMNILFIFFIAISSGQVFFNEDSFNNDDSNDVNIKEILGIEPPTEVSTRFQL